jgi:hypothetical protein
MRVDKLKFTPEPGKPEKEEEGTLREQPSPNPSHHSTPANCCHRGPTVAFPRVFRFFNKR